MATTKPDTVQTKAKKAPFVANVVINHDDQLFAPGATLELTSAQAEPLLVVAAISLGETAPEAA